MFYDKKIDIIGQSDGYLDDMGIYHEGIETAIKTIYADVQPYSKELAFKEHGFNEVVKYRFFAGNCALLELGAKVKYKNDNYIVKKIIEWDSYVEVLINVE